MFLVQDPNNRAKCAVFFRKCLDFLDEPDHLVLMLSIIIIMENFIYIYVLYLFSQVSSVIFFSHLIEVWG